MIPADTAAAALKEWLETESGYVYIQRLADRLKWDSRRQPVLLSSLTRRFGCSADDLSDELTQEFLAFLLQAFLPQLSSRPEQVNLVLTGQARKVLDYALRRFSWRLQDDARRKDVNPRAYLHRRIREVLGRDDRFVVHADGRNRLSCSLAFLAGTPFEKPSDFFSFEYSLWPAPPEPASRDTLFSAQYLSAAALLFLEEVVRQSGETGPVPVRELVRYFSAHFSWLTIFEFEQTSGDGVFPASTERAEDHLDHRVALKSIVVLAGQFVDTMDEPARKILNWRLADPPYSFEKIANFLELTTHNRPYRIHRNTIAAMRKFCADWPGPSLSELPEDVGIAFIEEVRKICKKSVC